MSTDWIQTVQIRAGKAPFGSKQVDVAPEEHRIFPNGSMLFRKRTDWIQTDQCSSGIALNFSKQVDVPPELHRLDQNSAPPRQHRTWFWSRGGFWNDAERES